MSERQRNWLRAVALLAAVVAGVAVLAAAAGAQEEIDQRFDNEYCLGCHDVPELPVPLPSGETLNAVVDREAYEGSVHGELGLPCVLCHTNIETFPHPALEADTLRGVSLDLYEACFGCHQEQYTLTLDNVHGRALEERGNPEAAVCTDCHGAHGVQRAEPRGVDIALTCRNCHSAIYDLYANSVHGSALRDGNIDVPTCTDCHGVHDAEGPTDTAFHLFSPQICANCHEDGELMDEYGISTAVFETYIADFHGSTVVLFEELAPDQDTNKPVCSDCHGVHNIVATEDANSTVFKENVLGTCQRCHPDASTNFPTAWLSHHQPSPGETPLVYLAGLVYRIAIPVIIGAMIVFVTLDARRRRLARRRTEQPSHG